MSSTLRAPIALFDYLQRLGVSKGDRVGIWSPNRSEWLVTQFATAKAGLILVNIARPWERRRDPKGNLPALETVERSARVVCLVLPPGWMPYGAAYSPAETTRSPSGVRSVGVPLSTISHSSSE